MALVAGIGGGSEGVVEAVNAAAILGRGVPFAANVARVGGLARLEHLAQPDLAGAAQLGSPVFIRRQPVSALADGKLPEVVVIATWTTSCSP